MSPSDSLSPQHLPGRSRTKSAWGALITLLFFAAIWGFHPVILRTSVRTALWATRPFTGLTIKARRLQVTFGQPLRWDKVTITSGQPPYQSQYQLRSLSLGLSSPWRIFFGDHLLVDSIEASGGKGLIDLRIEKNQQPHFFSEEARKLFYDFFHKKVIPPTIAFNDLSFILMANDQRYSVNNFSFSNKNSSTFSYSAIAIEAGGVSCHLPQASCEASWDGKAITLKQLSLTNDIVLQNLKVTPEGEHISFGLTSEIFEGIFRADGSIIKTDSGPIIDAAILGQKLPLDRLSKFLGFTKKISGNLREARLTFRGSPFYVIDAEASLRVIADNFGWDKRGRAGLSIVANLIGRKISVTDFQLKQEDNHVAASGEMTLPTEWHKIAQAPFLLKLKATIPDASQLADFVGKPWNNITGKFFVDSELQGAENSATGYLNAQGSSITTCDLPINSLKLQLLFQGEKTDLTNLDVWSGSDRLQLSGIIENRWPHHYNGKGKINSGNIAQQLSFFGMNKANLIHNGSLEASWNGEGSATNQNGSFDFSLYQMSLGSKEVSAHWSGCYTTNQLECPTFLLQENENKLSTALTLSRQGISLNKLSLSQNDNTTLSGNIFIPINPEALFHGTSWIHSLAPATPLTIDLAVHHLPIQNFSPFFSNQLLSGFLDGKIHASGPWREPSLNLSLQGEKVLPNILSSNISEKNQPNFFNVTINAEKGKAFLDASIHSAAEQPITLRGSFPLAPAFENENTDHEIFRLGPVNAPLDLSLVIPQIALNELAPKIVPSKISISQGIVSGELSIQGTLSNPSILGHLQLLAEKISLGTLLSPLHAVRAKLSLTPEKITLTEASAMMGNGKMNASGSSDVSSWKKFNHHYEIAGKQLLLHQSETATFTGNADIRFQGNENKGSAEGTVNLTDIHWKPILHVTPFLIPPGILINNELSSTNISVASDWITDIAIKNSAEKSALGSSNLHLIGTIFSPTLDGSIALNQLKIEFPQTGIMLKEGSLVFSVENPWNPEPCFIGRGSLHGQNFVSHASPLNHRSLFFESEAEESQETLALSLAMPKNILQLTPGWIEELPYWMRQQECEKPVTFLHQSPSPLETEGLGFSSHAISYYFELK